MAHNHLQRTDTYVLEAYVFFETVPIDLNNILF